MKISVVTIPDFDFEVVDVVLRIEEGDSYTNCWIKGFDDDEWEAAEQYAREFAKLVHCEYAGEYAE